MMAYGPPVPGVSPTLAAGYAPPAAGSPWPPQPSAMGAPVLPAPRRSSAMSGARLLAWVGGAVTLLGVVLLFALAASRGWFEPPVRIAAGAVLGAALVGLGVRLHAKESARAGAVALAATGFATLYLAVAAASALYHYLAPVPALLVVLLVAAAALTLADRWRSQLLAVAATAGGVLLAPVLADGWLLVAPALVLQVAAVVVVLRRHWAVLMLVAAAGPVLYGAIVGASEAWQGTNGPAVAVGLAVITLAVGLGTAMLTARVLAAGPVAVLVAAAALPSVAVAPAIGGTGGGGVALLAALLLGAFAALPGLPTTARTVAVATAVVALLVATAVALDGAAATIAVLGEAVAAAVVALVVRSRFALATGAVLGAIGTMIAMGRDAPLGSLIVFPDAPLSAGAGMLLTELIVGALVMAVAVTLLLAGGRLGLIRPDSASAPLWVGLGLVGLYGATAFVVTAALLVSPDRAGFTAGHATVTVLWTVAALVLLARGISRPALRVAGMVLVGAAVAKLVLFDLTALDGLARVGAFLGAGLVLLAAGTRYARLVAEAESRHEPGLPTG